MRIIRFRVTLTMRSGRRVTFHCASLRKGVTDGELTTLAADGSPNWPFYIRLEDVAAVTSRRVIAPIWRWWS